MAAAELQSAVPNETYNEVFEEAGDERQEQTIHHIRANSSIMQLKKILGKETPGSAYMEVQLLTEFSAIQLLTVVKFVSFTPHLA